MQSLTWMVAGAVWPVVARLEDAVGRLQTPPPQRSTAQDSPGPPLYDLCAEMPPHGREQAEDSPFLPLSGRGEYVDDPVKPQPTTEDVVRRRQVPVDVVKVDVCDEKQPHGREQAEGPPPLSLSGRGAQVDDPAMPPSATEDVMRSSQVDMSEVQQPHGREQAEVLSLQPLSGRSEQVDDLAKPLSLAEAVVHRTQVPVDVVMADMCDVKQPHGRGQAEVSPLLPPSGRGEHVDDPAMPQLASEDVVRCSQVPVDAVKVDMSVEMQPHGRGEQAEDTLLPPPAGRGGHVDDPVKPQTRKRRREVPVDDVEVVMRDEQQPHGREQAEGISPLPPSGRGEHVDDPGPPLYDLCDEMPRGGTVPVVEVVTEDGSQQSRSGIGVGQLDSMPPMRGEGLGMAGPPNGGPPPNGNMGDEKPPLDGRGEHVEDGSTPPAAEADGDLASQQSAVAAGPVAGRATGMVAPEVFFAVRYKYRVFAAWRRVRPAGRTRTKARHAASGASAGCGCEVRFEGLCWDRPIESLREVFAAYGPVLSIQLWRDEWGDLTGAGACQFLRQAGARHAVVELNGQVCDAGTPVYVFIHGHGHAAYG